MNKIVAGILLLKLSTCFVNSPTEGITISSSKYDSNLFYH